MGGGEPIICNHGLSEDVGYWTGTMVAGEIARHYRFIPYEMRGHGRTVITGEPKGCDVDTMIGDINDLADHLGLKKFHLMSHATGGMLCARYGMKHSDRLLSLLLIDTGSATIPAMPAPYNRPPPNITPEERQRMREEYLKRIDDKIPQEERYQRWLQAPGPYMFTIAARPEPERRRMWEIFDGCYQRRLSQRALFEFMTSFYTDSDPQVERLKGIKCPTLIMCGEHDVVFVPASEIMAKAIPDNRFVLIPGAGHMTTLEAPEETAKQVLDFLNCVREKVKAK
jgi:pimeloyl-ACP methyl ester carboxylesterase